MQAVRFQHSLEEKPHHPQIRRQMDESNLVDSILEVWWQRGRETPRSVRDGTVV